MRKIYKPLLPSLFLLFSLSSLLLPLAADAFSQSPQPSSVSSPTARISAEITDSQRTQLPNSRHPLAQSKYDSGRLAASTKLQGISIYFNRTPSQEADLKLLMAAQQDPASPLYHQWLTPEQYAARFGMADSDIAKVQSWLEQQGFSVDSVNRSQNAIHFSGTVRQVEAAFATEMHTYNIPTATGIQQHFAPSTALSVPSALAGVVESVRNLNDFRPRSHAVANKVRSAKPNFTSSVSGDVFFAPGDIATIYDIQSVYQSGNTGSGQSIAIVGQSSVALSDIESFQTASGLTVKDPTLVLMPGTGSATVFSGDESESDLDLEWSGGTATGANIFFVYTGSNTNYGAFDALEYAIDNQIGTIISSSYGECEADLGGQNLESALQQAATQGQTVISASGDSGSTDCFIGNDMTNPPLSTQETLAVDYPASSAYVTGVGGTEISTANSSYLTPGDGYWESASSSDVITSALKYIPEQVWNEDLANCGTDDCILAGGGGASALFPKPSWQTGVPGIPTGNTRFVPDISLNASTALPGYLLCTSDTSFWQQGQTSSCTSGFRDSVTGDLTAAGGTSFAAPIFAGIVALINDAKGYSGGQGLVNSTLYQLASNSATYASAFHDITSGNNNCLAGSGYCSSAQGFAATAGYDEASGLGSLDVANLAGVWPANTETTLIGTTTTVSASNAAPAIGASDTFTVTVASSTGTAVPTGTVTITVDSNNPITGNALTNGVYTYTTSFSTSGMHQVLVTYSGDATHAASTGSVTVNVPVPVSGKGTFTLSATNVSVAQGSSGSSTITVTPASGYTGTVEISFDTSNDNALQNLCYEFTNTQTDGDGIVDVSNTSAVTTQLTLDTNAADCLSPGEARKSGKHQLGATRRLRATNQPDDKGTTKATAAGLVMAGLLLAGFVGRRSRRLRGLVCLILLAAAGMAISACGGSSNSTTASDPPKGTYTVTLMGQDTSSSTIPTTTSTFTFTIN